MRLIFPTVGAQSFPTRRTRPPSCSTTSPRRIVSSTPPVRRFPHLPFLLPQAPRLTFPSFTQSSLPLPFPVSSTPSSSSQRTRTGNFIRASDCSSSGSSDYSHDDDADSSRSRRNVQLGVPGQAQGRIAQGRHSPSYASSPAPLPFHSTTDVVCLADSLHLLYNVNFSIVSQVNPHIHLLYVISLPLSWPNPVFSSASLTSPSLTSPSFPLPSPLPLLLVSVPSSSSPSYPSFRLPSADDSNFAPRGSPGRPVAHRKGKGWRGGFWLAAGEQFWKIEMVKWFRVRLPPPPPFPLVPAGGDVC